MNKQEAMDVIESISYYEKVNGNPLEDLVNKIYDDLKPVVPKFVADWYESLNRNEDSFRKIFPFVHAPHESANDTSWIPEDVQIWLSNWDNSFTLSNMHQFGYAVEQEKLYTVEIPNPNNEYSMNALIRLPSGKIALVALHKPNTSYLKNKEHQITESEIKQDFEWAWQWAKPVEVE